MKSNCMVSIIINFIYKILLALYLACGLYCFILVEEKS